jgi:hypothetical protein
MEVMLGEAGGWLRIMFPGNSKINENQEKNPIQENFDMRDKTKHR